MEPASFEGMHEQHDGVDRMFDEAGASGRVFEVFQSDDAGWGEPVKRPPKPVSKAARIGSHFTGTGSQETENEGKEREAKS